MKAFRYLVVSSLAFLLVSVVSAGELNLNDPHRLESDRLRDATSKPEQILKLMDIQPGWVVADILGGGGYYSELLSQLVGAKGKVYLHNNQAYMPYVEKELEQRFADNQLPNIIRHNRETENLDFAANSLDAAIFVMGYHDMYHVGENWTIDKEDMLLQINRALKPGAKILVIDHSAEIGTGSSQAQELHRIDETFVIKDMEHQGFKLITKSDLLRNPNDDRKGSPFAKEIRRKTDRFVLVFTKL